MRESKQYEETNQRRTFSIIADCPSCLFSLTSSGDSVKNLLQLATYAAVNNDTIALLILLARRLYNSVIGCNTKEYSSLTPYAMHISGYSNITVRAAAFIRSRARESFGLIKL